MDTRSKLVALAAFFFCGLSQAAYMSVTPGPAFSKAATSGENLLYKAMVSDYVRGGMVRTGEAGVLNLFKPEKVPGAMKYAVSAARVAAGFAFGNPLLFIAAGVAYAGYEYYRSAGFELCTTAQGTGWCQKSVGTMCASDCYLYTWDEAEGMSHSVAEACAKHNGHTYPNGYQLHCVNTNEGQQLDIFQDGEKIGSTWTSIYKEAVPPYDTTTITPTTKQVMEDAMSPTTLPDVLPQILPIPLPIENPILFPEPDPSPSVTPQVKPRSVPQRFPLSDPVPVVPATDPVTYKTPVIDVVPSPTLDDPWRVDTKPKDITSESPDALPPSAPASSPASSPTSEKPSAEKTDLCIDHPEIIACQIFKPDTVEPTVIPNVDKTITLSPDSGWGPSNGSCPAPKVITVHGQTLSFSLSMMCEFMTAVRPVILAVAWLSAVLLMLGIGRRA